MSRKLEKFVVLFDNTNLLYFPGQFLSGRVLVELKDDTQALGLHFHVIGEGVVRLKSKRRERIYDKENYIDFRMRLLGEPGQPPVMLSPGIHSFPFKLGLPPGLPSTFLGKSGWVQYYCKAALREPNSLTHKNQQVFIVMNPIDLNMEPSILSVEPFRCDIDHKLSKAMCLGSGLVECQVCLDKGAYVPGETIEITATVTNNSKVTIKSTRATLTETIQYFAKSKIIQSETRELASLKRDKIRPNEMDQWHNEQLYVPPLPPTNLRGCHLINIQYDIYGSEVVGIAYCSVCSQFIADQDGNLNYTMFIISPNNMEKDVKLQLPIMMGTYPFRTEDGSFDGKLGTHYPSTLPILRPWLEEKTFK